jgi:hypothetical protein
MSVRRMMESHYDSIMRRVLVLITGVLLAVALVGCQDPAAANFEAEHRRLSNIARQELRQGLSAHPMTSQAEALYTAP